MAREAAELPAILVPVPSVCNKRCWVLPTQHCAGRHDFGHVRWHTDGSTSRLGQQERRVGCKHEGAGWAGLHAARRPSLFGYASVPQNEIFSSSSIIMCCTSLLEDAGAMAAVKAGQGPSRPLGSTPQLDRLVGGRSETALLVLLRAGQLVGRGPEVHQDVAMDQTAILRRQ